MASGSRSPCRASRRRCSTRKSSPGAAARAWRPSRPTCSMPSSSAPGSFSRKRGARASASWRRRAMAEDFEFNENVARIFDVMLARSIPYYAEIQRMNVELAQRFVQPGSLVVDLGCSLGTTLIALAKGIDDPTVRFLGIDNSQAMLARARGNLEAAGVAKRCELRAADLNDELDLRDASVVIM